MKRWIQPVKKFGVVVALILALGLAFVPMRAISVQYRCISNPREMFSVPPGSPAAGSILQVRDGRIYVRSATIYSAWVLVTGIKFEKGLSDEDKKLIGEMAAGWEEKHHSAGPAGE
jgi:hypothetical protein